MLNTIAAATAMTLMTIVPGVPFVEWHRATAEHRLADAVSSFVILLWVMFFVAMTAVVAAIVVGVVMYRREKRLSNPRNATNPGDEG